MAITVAALLMLNLNSALAADGNGAWPGPASATTLSSSSATISGSVWYDDNPTNGAFDQVEDGLEGVTVDLYRDKDGDGVISPEDEPLPPQITSGDGIYHFVALSSGDYIVQVAETMTLGLAEYALTTDSSLSVHLEEEAYSGADFGYEGLADPTAVTLSYFVASSTSRGASSFDWLRLVASAMLAAGCTFWTRRQGRRDKIV